MPESLIGVEMDIKGCSWTAVEKSLGLGGLNLHIVSVYISTFYSFARSLLSALYCHGNSKFGSGPVGGGGGGIIIVLYGFSWFGSLGDFSHPPPQLRS